MAWIGRYLENKTFYLNKTQDINMNRIILSKTVSLITLLLI